MTFYEFIQGFTGDQTPLGELAAWVDKDVQFPKEEKLAKNIFNYFKQITNLDDEILEIVKRSLSIYEQNI
ncbi:YozE family protein [Staphylococcus pasteuri]|uniref:YozE family protein n=1 Tax=Staphylococcus pasteuri TaxID=45972 RepID=UPI0012B79A3A|nr:YozE family protein [Staphylococcus pasteuri]MCT1926346.1 sterile alpha motif-like domain-containing protein [Staphylococcus pasteuri]